jgi:hypothetical protein
MLRRKMTRQTAERTIQVYRSACCEARLELAAFSDGRRFLICSACGKVLAVEARRAQKSA